VAASWNRSSPWEYALTFAMKRAKEAYCAPAARSFRQFGQLIDPVD